MREKLVAVAKRFVSDVQRDDLAGLSAELAYRFLFAVFPFGLFVAALASFIGPILGLGDPTGEILGAIGDNLPPDVANAVRPQLEAVVGSAKPGLLTIGAIAALWAATGGTNALIKAMNRAYEVEETRPLIPRYALAIGLTLLASVGILAAFVSVVGASLATNEIVSRLALDPTVVEMVSLLRWPAVFVFLSTAVGILYKLAPNFDVPFRWALGGGALFSVCWLIATGLFALYVLNFGNYANTYGALAGVIVLMLWFYISAFVLVGAAALTAAALKELRPEEFARRRPVSLAAVAAEGLEPVDRPAIAIAAEDAGAGVLGDGSGTHARGSTRSSVMPVVTSRAGAAGAAGGRPAAMQRQPSQGRVWSHADAATARQRGSGAGSRQPRSTPADWLAAGIVTAVGAGLGALAAVALGDRNRR